MDLQGSYLEASGIFSLVIINPAIVSVFNRLRWSVFLSLVTLILSSKKHWKMKTLKLNVLLLVVVFQKYYFVLCHVLKVKIIWANIIKL